MRSRVACALWGIAVGLACLAAFANAQDRGWMIDAGTKDEARDKTTVIVRGEGDEPSDIEKAWFKDWKVYYNKTYSCPDEETKALKNFVKNMQTVQEVNYDMTRGWWASGNLWSDLDYATFKAKVLMDPSILAKQVKAVKGVKSSLVRKPLRVGSSDWRAKDRMMPVKDQGSCGSCWAFAATAVVESAYLTSQGLTASQASGLKLSTQQLIDCAGNSYNSAGCNGGNSDGAIQYISDNFQQLASDYPDRFADGSCRASNSRGRTVKLSNNPAYGPTGDEAGLMNILDTTPVVVYVAVGNDFQSYRGGVYTSSNCPSQVNHAVVLVGYYWSGSSSSSYFIMQNSWSSGWGENGFMKVQMTGNGDGLCKLYTFVTYPRPSFSQTLDGFSPNPNPTPDTPPGPDPNPNPEPDSPAAPRAPRRRRSPPPAPSEPDYPSEPDSPASPRAPRRRRSPPPPPPRKRSPPPPRKKRPPPPGKKRSPPPSAPSWPEYPSWPGWPSWPRAPRSPRSPRAPRTQTSSNTDTNTEAPFAQPCAP